MLSVYYHQYLLRFAAERIRAEGIGTEQRYFSLNQKNGENGKSG
jgi:hypothetical protein